MQCFQDDDCPFLYDCVKLTCTHYSLLYFTPYTVIIFLLIPFLVALANIAGVSAGFLKIIVFMDFLNYMDAAATLKSYPIILGGGIANFALLINLKNPFREGPCINYNVANIMLPGVVIGSIFGSLMNSLVPEFILDILSLCLCLFLFILFFNQFSDYEFKKRIQEGQFKKLLPQRYNNPKKRRQSLQLPQIIEQDGQCGTQYAAQHGQEVLSPGRKRAMRQDIRIQKSIQVPLKQIAFSFSFFLVIETFALLFQGKIVKFSICEGIGGLAMLLLFLVLIIIQILHFCFILKPKYQAYEDFRLQDEINLSQGKNVIIITTGAFVGGFLTGMLAIGEGPVVLLVLIYLGLPQKIAIATNGYQVIFMGIASTLQASIFGYLQWQDLLFLLLLALIGSFFLTMLGYQYLQKFPDNGTYITYIVLMILVSLCFIGVAAHLGINLKNFGFPALMIPHGLQC